jgi:hypothetical protein
MLSIICVFIFACLIVCMGYLTSQTSDIYFDLAIKNLKQSVENHEQNKSTSDFVHEYLPKILEEVRKR